MSLKDSTWAAKAHALLWLPRLGGRAGDPLGEQLWQALNDLGFEADPGLQPELTRAREWAYDANFGGKIPDPSAGDVPLRHPLSAEVLASVAIPSFTEIRQLLQASRGGGDRAEDRYRHLWFDLAMEPWFNGAAASAAMPDHSLRAAGSLAAAYAGIAQRGETPALLYFHVGPVQSFIEAARRTQDLWVGSFTVASLALEAALAIAEQEGPDAILYPDLVAQPLARKRLLGRMVNGERSRLTRAAVPNRLLALVPSSRAGELADEIATRVRGRWTEMAGEVQKGLQNVAGSADWTRGFDEQIGAHLELDAVVLPWPESWAEIEALGQHYARPIGNPGGVGIGAAYGGLFHLVHGALSAHRSVGRIPDPVAQTDEDRRPKCSQCGQRAQMGPIAKNPSQQQEESRRFWENLSTNDQERQAGPARGEEDEGRSSLQLTIGDGLCAVCLTKRFAPELYFGGKGSPLGLNWAETESDRPLLRFPSVESIASAPFRWWIAKSPPAEAAQWSRAVRSVCKRDALDFDPPGNLLSALGDLGRSGDFRDLDGSWCYESAYDPEVAWRDHVSRPFDRSSSDDRDRMAKIKERLGSAGDCHQKLLKKLATRPSAYYAVVKLDGDEMGKWLTGRHPKAPSIDEISPAVDSALGAQRRPLFPALHGELSRRLGDLAEKGGPEIVDRHLGRIVYSGGDDLLAILPLQTVLPCLDSLRETIRSKDYLGSLVTASAGVAITHCRNPLQRAIAMARRAEQEAKAHGGDRVAFHLEPRSGVERQVVLEWGPAAPAAKSELALLQELLTSIRDSKKKDDGDVDRDVDNPYLSPNYAHQLELDAQVLEADPASFQALLQRKLEKFAPAGAQVPPILASGSPRRIANLLLLARFLLREEQGIPTAELLKEPPAASGEARP